MNSASNCRSPFPRSGPTSWPCAPAHWCSPPVTATVNAEPDFTDHTAVADGASDLFVSVLGEAGSHARLAVGVNSLPANAALEIQAVVEHDL